MQLRYDEIKHMKLHRFISEHSPEGKATIDYILNREYNIALHLQNTSASPTAPVCLINYYYHLASVGTGQILFDMPPTKKIEIPDTPQNRTADYAIGVNGDSMKPIYEDGDMLLIEMTEDIEIGDIGIFSVNEECYMKKLGEKELISLNTEYPNISLNASATRMGKVIGKL